MDNNLAVKICMEIEEIFDRYNLTTQQRIGLCNRLVFLNAKIEKHNGSNNKKEFIDGKQYEF